MTRLCSKEKIEIVYKNVQSFFVRINLKDRDFSGVLCKLRRSFNRLTLWRYIELACTGWQYSGGEQSIVQYSKFRFRVGEDTIFSAIGEGRHFELFKVFGNFLLQVDFFPWQRKRQQFDFKKLVDVGKIGILF